MLAQRELRNNSTHTGAAYREHLHCALQSLNAVEANGKTWTTKSFSSRFYSTNIVSCRLATLYNFRIRIYGNHLESRNWTPRYPAPSRISNNDFFQVTRD